jgi:hypothetical protein
MNNDNSSITYVGRYGLLFTDEDGTIYNVHIETFGNGGRLLKSGIEAINGNKRLNDNDREMIVSKILSLTPDIKWEIK